MNARYPSLEGRRVFITGAATGIGAAFVEAFAAQGARVAFIDRDAEAGEALAAAHRAWFRALDVTDVPALRQAVTEAAAELGGLDILINNVANDQRHAATSLDDEAWRAHLAVNLDPVVHASNAAQPFLSKGGGAILNLSSINALLAPAELAAYNAAKAAILALTKSLAREWGADNIRVNAISPGWVATERQLALWLTPQAEAEWMKDVALKRRITPADVARLALFLASDEASAITGQNFIIDGGRV